MKHRNRILQIAVSKLRSAKSLEHLYRGGLRYVARLTAVELSVLLEEGAEVEGGYGQELAWKSWIQQSISQGSGGKREVGLSLVPEHLLKNPVKDYFSDVREYKERKNR